MCDFCDYKICKDSEGNFFIKIETLDWDDYYDQYKTVYFGGIKYCPFCGIKLGDEDKV